LRLFASVRNSLARRSVHARRPFVFGVPKYHRLVGPEGGAATERFLVLQHERGRRAALGPRVIDTHSGHWISASGRKRATELCTRLVVLPQC
jgi:hypothetical protein